MTLLWFLALAGLPLCAVAFALFLKGAWSTRVVPADAFRVVTGVAFAALVDPVFGALAALSAVWWVRYGWLRLPGGTFWPVVAAAVWLGLQTPEAVLYAGIVALLMVGVLQVGVGLFQALPYRPPSRLAMVLASLGAGESICGTLGHRTGLGIYLAILTPLGFLSDYGPALAGVYAVGILLTRSSVASVAALGGIVVAAPSWWPYALALALAGIWLRAVSWSWRRPFYVDGLKNVRDALGSRAACWTATVRHLGWPHWLIGHGPGSFEQDGWTWVRSDRTPEVFREAHNDYLEWCYEYGFLGAALVALWALSYGGALALGDPVTAGVVAYAIAMCANFPSRVAPISALALVLAILVMRQGQPWALPGYLAGAAVLLAAVLLVPRLTARPLMQPREVFGCVLNYYESGQIGFQLSSFHGVRHTWADGRALVQMADRAWARMEQQEVARSVPQEMFPGRALRSDRVGA